MAAVTVPPFLKAGRIPRMLSIVTPLRIFVVGNDRITLAALDGDGCNFGLEPTCSPGGLRQILLANGKSVLICARHLISLGQILSRDAHLVAVEGVGQPILHYRVNKAKVAHFLTAADLLGMDGHRHGLLAARDNNSCIACRDCRAARATTRRPDPQT